MRLPCAAAVLIIVSTVSADCAAQSGWGALLKNTPLEDFTQQDRDQYFAVLNAALEAPMPVEPREWHNDVTGSGARIEVLGARQVANFDDCRRVRTDLYSKKRRGMVRSWTACKGADGKWELVSAN